MAQQELGQPVPGAEQVGADVFATPQQVADGFFLLGGNVNRRQGTGAIQDDELDGVAPVGLNAIARAAWNQRGRDDVTLDPIRRQGALQLEAAGPGLVATAHRAVPLELLDEAPDRRHIRGELVDRRLPGAGDKDRRGHGRGVLIEGHNRRRLEHDRPPLYAALL
jgi:hypothetical protein